MAGNGDARLMAYGKLVDALPGLLNAEGRHSLCGWLAERQVLHDGQEDPGAVPVEGLETELAIAQVFRELAERMNCQAP